MKRIVIYLALIILIACRVEPEAIRYGSDGCYSCKMTLIDKRFGAEVVTTKGKVYKFDDVNCLMSFLGTGEVGERDAKFILVTDFSQPEKLIDATIAFYVKSPEIKSPMASQVAAFETDEAYKQYKRDLNGIYLTWGELTTQFK